ADGRGLREPAAQARGIEVQEAFRRAQARHGHEHVLAGGERGAPDGQLRRVGIALQPACGGPLRQRRETLGGGLRAAEVRNPVRQRERKAAEAATREQRPDRLAQRLLVGSLRRRAGALARYARAPAPPGHRGACGSWGPSRSGEALISTALPCARAAANTASRSTSYGSREPSRRPVGCPRMSMCGLPSARTMRAVIVARSCLKREWTDATTTSSSASTSSGKYSAPSSKTTQSA